jgi:hypothetical protein
MYQVVTQKDVPVYEQPDSHSRVVSYLSYDVVLTKLAAGKPWANVEYTQSRFGYVRAEAMANPTGLIVKLQRSGDGWKIKGLDEFYE